MMTATAASAATASAATASAATTSNHLGRKDPNKMAQKQVKLAQDRSNWIKIG